MSYNGLQDPVDQIQTAPGAGQCPCHHVKAVNTGEGAGSGVLTACDVRTSGMPVAEFDPEADLAVGGERPGEVSGTVYCVIPASAEPTHPASWNFTCAMVGQERPYDRQDALGQPRHVADYGTLHITNEDVTPDFAHRIVHINRLWEDRRGPWEWGLEEEQPAFTELVKASPQIYDEDHRH